ncbi:MAG: 30S ribosomal protein S12 methylthiotransferase RimO, partial [Candidatus Obscuribacterales bacterium]|nr:30S ribosomal protein S12 methylthiotransferase RimO [Candidatus Obscuribacterales bacterium]
TTTVIAAFGCDHSCSFCIIPILRGKFRSRSIESLVKEARVLVKAGVREIILVCQDSTYYGLDIYGHLALPELLSALNQIEGLEWIRVMYAYPTEATFEILDAIASLEKVVKYIDIPLQHSHPEVLKAMKRPLHPQKVVARIRELVPDVKIRSTFIVGFPGETEEHFEHLLDFVKESCFDRMGVFTYSKQVEVESGHMKNQLPEKVKRSRRGRLMKVQHEIARAGNEAMVGREIDVLIESYDDSRDLYIGRSQWDAPDIDNQIFVSDNDSLVDMGEICRVQVNKAKAYDLYGIAIDTQKTSCLEDEKDFVLSS